MTLRKDRALDALAENANVAQFVSFAPTADKGLLQQYSRLAGFEPNHNFSTPLHALSTLLALSSDGTINIRSYALNSTRSREFVYGITSAEKALAVARRLTHEGLFVIANETIDVSDGGVSGVVQCNIIEFAPDDTPRCVEMPGVASLPDRMGLSILSKVYGFAPEIGDMSNARIEFSIHPKPRGWKNSHTVTWEYEQTPGVSPAPTMIWPNRFSRHIGDKVFGLLMAEEIGLPVPRTTVFARRVAPFSFGKPTGSLEVWTRTAPVEPEPGRYTTLKGWTDPYRLLANEDVEGKSIASVLCQSAVPARYSGATIVTSDGNFAVEGRQGEGDGLMLGKLRPEPLPSAIVRDVELAYDRLEKALGPVRFEWVHDGATAWIVQLHRGQTESSATILVPGEADWWIDFEVSRGLDVLRETLAELPPHTGMTMVGDIGLTSHIADLLRKAKRPTRIVKGPPVGALAPV